MKRILALAACLLPLPALAHHGVASLGTAGISGPGAPIETSSSATLPQGQWLGYLKLDDARYRTYTPARDGESERAEFWMVGLGYGVTPWLSAYLFVPYAAKVTEDSSYTTAGFTDLSLMGVVGFKWDGGLMLVPTQESMDDLEDWHFTLYGGGTLPTGNPNTTDSSGAIDPGMSLGFGKATLTLGATATKTLGDRITAVGEVSMLRFQTNTYADGATVRFGAEDRLNAAIAARLWSDGASRLDLNLEANFLRLGRDQTNGVGDTATGGDILYTVPGIRYYRGSTSLGLGVKMPIWSRLNEASQQQGAEGKEKYRLVATWSVLF